MMDSEINKAILMKLLEVEKAFFDHCPMEGVSSTKKTIQHMRVRRKLLAVHEAMMETLHEERERQKTNPFLIDELFLPSEDDLSLESTSSTDMMWQPAVKFLDDGRATCTHCAYTWDGDSQHVCEL